MKNETIKVTSAVGANEPPQEAPQAADHLAAAIAVKRAAQAKPRILSRRVLPVTGSVKQPRKRTLAAASTMQCRMEPVLRGVVRRE